MRDAIRHLLLLTALCWATYFPGLATHGLTNWQEAQRGLVAREMQTRHEWIVPTVDGRPYLAKPPLIYWSQLALASCRGVVTGEFELRLTVALAGWLGVLATYVAARRMVGGVAAWWAGIFLTGGLLYARSSRIGEIDILMAPFTSAAIGALYVAWQSHLERRRTHLTAVLLAIAAACGAMLAKGPPALLAIGLAGYGSIALHEAWSSDVPKSVTRSGAVVGALILAGETVWLNRSEPWGPADVAGVGMFGLMGAGVGVVLARLGALGRWKSLLAASSRTHPVAVLGIPLLVLWGWGRLVTARIGPEAVAAAVRTETLDNLRPLVAESPINNLEAMTYAVGLGSLAAAGCAVWMIHRRIRPTPARWVLIAWVVGGFCAFSLLGKGVVRYLTPVWPGVAIVGGVWFEHALSRVRSPRRLGLLTATAAVALCLGQSWWYGFERERKHPERSPRAMMKELVRAPGVDPGRISMFEFESPAVDYYVGASVDSLADVVPRPGLVGIGPGTIRDLHDRLEREDSDWTLLIRRTQPSSMISRLALDRLHDAGFVTAPIPLTARFVIDNNRTDVDAVRVRRRSAR
jgi:4-amino-4-deoxy-L-arabinose transferase-like glycosyltransferase